MNPTLLIYDQNHKAQPITLLFENCEMKFKNPSALQSSK